MLSFLTRLWIALFFHIFFHKAAERSPFHISFYILFALFSIYIAATQVGAIVMPRASGAKGIVTCNHLPAVHAQSVCPIFAPTQKGRASYTMYFFLRCLNSREKRHCLRTQCILSSVDVDAVVQRCDGDFAFVTFVFFVVCLSSKAWIVSSYCGIHSHHQPEGVSTICTLLLRVSYELTACRSSAHLLLKAK